jgi:hypothetical protein
LKNEKTHSKGGYKMTDNIEERLKEMEKKIERLEAYNEIQNLVAKYVNIHTPLSMHLSPELFALKQPDVSVEIAMWGKLIGADQVNNMFKGMSERKPEPGTMFEHQLTTPVIQVADDCKTAKGLWFSPGHETTKDEDGNLQPHWCYGKFGADFIKEDGKWKIWHYHWYDTFMVPYDKSWVDAPQPGPDEVFTPPGITADEPPTSRSTYFTDQVRKPIPEYPEPYETWDGKSVC